MPNTSAAGGGVQVTDIRFIDANTGFASTTDGKLYRTADGANSWTSVSDTQRVVREVIFLDTKRGYAVGDGSLFLSTDDAGLTWKPRALALPSQVGLHSISCATAEWPSAA